MFPFSGPTSGKWVKLQSVNSSDTCWISISGSDIFLPESSNYCVVSSTKEACNSNPITAFKVVRQISLVWNTCTHGKTVETEFVVSPNFELLQGVTLPTLAQGLYYIRYTNNLKRSFSKRLYGAYFLQTCRQESLGLRLQIPVHHSIYLRSPCVVNQVRMRLQVQRQRLPSLPLQKMHKIYARTFKWIHMQYQDT